MRRIAAAPYYSATGLPDASFTFERHCVRISVVTVGSGCCSLEGQKLDDAVVVLYMRLHNPGPLEGEKPREAQIIPPPNNVDGRSSALICTVRFRSSFAGRKPRQVADCSRAIHVAIDTVFTPFFFPHETDFKASPRFRRCAISDVRRRHVRPVLDASFARRV